MTAVWGGLLAAGALLVTAPWLWPRRSDRHGAGRGRLGRLLDEAGFAHVRVRVLVAASLAVGALSGVLAAAVLGVAIVAVTAGCAGAVAPYAWLRARRAARRRRRWAVWPDVCEHIVAGVRAGLSVTDAVSALQATGPEVLRPAFARFALDMAASGNGDSSLVRLKTALADPVADRIIETLRMARQVGGTKLGTVLRALASSVREEAALRAEVDARQSWVRAAAALGVIAPWVVLVLLASRPEGARAYSSPEGILLVLGGAAVSVVAYRLMLRLGRLPEQARWFA
ncbi:type II secretion system F family protein [Microbacterium sp. NPDC078428]|uniref:type II secretion system F family protein n=1 Tax=Microbacterium sp. NPDC078428 TaxID=3364190 RepID=UPI0037CBCD2D